MKFKSTFHATLQVVFLLYIHTLRRSTLLSDQCKAKKARCRDYLNFKLLATYPSESWQPVPGPLEQVPGLGTPK